MQLLFVCQNEVQVGNENALHFSGRLQAYKPKNVSVEVLQGPRIQLNRDILGTALRRPVIRSGTTSRALVRLATFPLSPVDRPGLMRVALAVDGRWKHYCFGRGVLITVQGCSVSDEFNLEKTSVRVMSRKHQFIMHVPSARSRSRHFSGAVCIIISSKKNVKLYGAFAPNGV